jgi:hypothetical protein
VADDGVDRTESVEHEQQVVGRDPDVGTAAPITAAVTALVDQNAGERVVEEIGDADPGAAAGEPCPGRNLGGNRPIRRSGRESSRQVQRITPR